MPKYRVEVRSEQIGNWSGDADDEADARERAIQATIMHQDWLEYTGELVWYDGEITTNKVELEE